MNKLFVAVAGTLGVGKTTFVNFIAKEFGYYKIEENFKDNPYLKSFYKDKKRWAFHSEMFFLVEKVRQIQSINPMYGKKSVVLDVPIYVDVFSYGGALLKEGSMSEDEWNVYMDAYREFEKNLLKPDIIIYLDAPVEVLYQRIMERGRSFETQLGRNKLIKYLTTLKRLNEKWIKYYSKSIKIVTIDLKDYNYIKDKTKRALLQAKLRSILT